MSRIPFQYRLLKPKYWPSWLAMGLWWAMVNLLPFVIQAWLGRRLGDLLYWLNIERVRVARRNIETCYPNLAAHEVEALTRENLQSTSIGIFESGAAWFLPRWRLASKCEYIGLEHLQQAEAENSGVLFMGLHFTAIEIGAAFVNLRHPIDGFYRPHKNPVYEYVQAYGRIRHHELSQVIPNADLRGIVKALRSGEAVNYAPDQDYGRRRSVFVPFFGVSTATVKAPAQLAKSGNAKIIPWVTTRLSDFGRYQVRIYPPLDLNPDNDDETNAIAINRFAEDRINECTAQYLWVHRRFKTRPEGEPSLYFDLK